METKRYVQIGIMLAVILVMGQSVFAVSLSSDPAAMPAFRGSSSFTATTPDGTLRGSVDFAVYDKNHYDGVFGTRFANSYVYAYQVFNDNDSDVAIDYFSVGLFADATAQNAAYDPTKGFDAPWGSIPNTQSVLSQSVVYLFPSDNIGAGEHSLTLLFTSDSAPDMARGAVSGGFTGGATMDLPTPGWVTPEPATLGLLIGGAFMAIRRKTKGLR
jgi:hypothetical protein